MAYLTESELITRSHQEVITAITEGDDTIVPIIIDECIAQMKGYLTARYDTEAIFQKTGNDRDKVVVKMLKNLVIYEIYALHNPAMMTDVVKDNHGYAIEWLKGVQAQKINPALPVADEANPITYMVGGGNTKRGNHY